MSALNTFINHQFRPDIHGAMLDKRHHTRFLINWQAATHSEQPVHAICFGPKQDKVLVNLEHAIFNKDNILFFYYEDIHKRWSYIQTPEKSYFIYQKNRYESLIVYPKTLYIRGCYTTPHTRMWRILGNFYHFVNQWPGKVLCAPKNQCANESKPFQLNHSLRKAAQHLNNISIGKTYIIKGQSLYERKIAHKNYIVKSLSGVRSIVVDEAIFSHWNKTAIQHLPVMFQAKVSGQDLRVHYLENKTFSKCSLTKENVDYRYDKHFFELKTLKKTPQNIKIFANLVAKFEHNTFIGIDFIKTKQHYVVLEANPSPGWSAYHECDGIHHSAFMKKLLQVLKS